MSHGDLDLEVLADMSFWYHLSFTELVTMPRWALNIYVEALPRLVASLQGMMITAGAFPYLTRGGQSSVLAELRSADARKAVTPRTREEHEALLVTAGIGLAWEDDS